VLALEKAVDLGATSHRALAALQRALKAGYSARDLASGDCMKHRLMCLVAPLVLLSAPMAFAQAGFQLVNEISVKPDQELSSRPAAST
jgi:hypothetical protein